MKWHGYEQAARSLSGRPWWRQHEVQGFRRSDGLELHRAIGGWGLFDGPAVATLLIARGTQLAEFSSEGRSISQILEQVDAEHPLPVPEPKCGQVWVWLEDGVDESGGRMEKGEEAMITRLHNLERTWPPPGAVLVAGPGAPWAGQD